MRTKLEELECRGFLAYCTVYSPGKGIRGSLQLRGKIRNRGDTTDCESATPDLDCEWEEDSDSGSETQS